MDNLVQTINNLSIGFISQKGKQISDIQKMPPAKPNNAEHAIDKILEK